jgi:hypothetical protein
MKDDFITVKLFRKSHSKVLRHLEKNGGGIANFYSQAVAHLLKHQKKSLTQTIPSSDSNIVSSTDKPLK